MNQEELKQRLIELITTTFECEESADCNQCKYNRSINCLVERTADNLIANGVTIRERGEWEMQKFPLTECSVCKILRDCEHEKGWEFCPHCGADMRGVKDE